MSRPQVSDEMTQPASSGQLADTQRADAMGVAKRVEAVGRAQHHGIGPLHELHGVAYALAQVVGALRVHADELGGDLGIG